MVDMVRVFSYRTYGKVMFQGICCYSRKSALAQMIRLLATVSCPERVGVRFALRAGYRVRFALGRTGGDLVWYCLVTFLKQLLYGTDVAELKLQEQIKKGNLPSFSVKHVNVSTFSKSNIMQLGVWINPLRTHDLPVSYGVIVY